MHQKIHLEEKTVKMMRKVIILLLIVLGTCNAAVAQTDNADKYQTISELMFAIRDGSPSKIADFDFDDLMRDADENLLLSLTQVICTAPTDRITTYDIKKYYIPYFARLITALCQNNAVMREMSMGRTSFIDSYLEQVKNTTGVAELRNWLGDFWMVAYSAYAYIQGLGYIADSGLDVDTFRDNDLYYLEASLYGRPVYMGERTRRNIPPEVLRKLADIYGLDPDGPDILMQISQNLWTSCNPDNQQFIADNAYEIIVFASWVWSTVQVSNASSIVGNALRAMGRGDELYDLTYKAGHARYGDAFDMVYYTSVMSTDGNIDAFNDFVNLRERLKAEGCKFAEYNLMECPPEYFNDKRFENYYEQYARLQWHLIREMGVNDLTAYTASAVVAEFLNFFGCENLPVFYSHVLQVAMDMYFRGHTWAMDTIERTLPMVYSCGLNYPSTMCAVANYYYGLGNLPKVEYILQAYNVIRYADECELSNDEFLYYDLQVIAQTAGLLAIIGNDLNYEEYLKTAERLAEKALKNIDRLDDKDDLKYYLYGFLSDYYYTVNNYDTSRALINKALAHKQDKNSRLWLTFSLFSCEYALGNYAAAKKYGEKIAAGLDDVGTFKDEFFADLIKCSAYTGDLKRLKLFSDRYIDAVHEQITTKVFNLSGDEREVQWNNLRNNITPVMECFSADKITDKMIDVLAGVLYEWSLISKGLLLEADNVMDRKLSNHPNEAVRTRYLQMKNLAAQVENDILHNTGTSQLSFSKGLLERAQQDVISVMRENNIEYEMSGHLNIHWQDVRDRLQKNEAAIEFGYVDIIEEGDDTPTPLYYAIVLRKEFDTPMLVSLCTDKQIRSACGSLRDARLYIAGTPMKKLYALLWEPLEDFINEGDTVYFSTDGQLHLLNMEVLRDEQGVFADERYNLRRLSSTRELCIDRDRSITEARLYGGLNYRMGTEELQKATAEYADANIRRSSVSRGSVSATEVPRESLPGTLPEVEDISDLLNRHGVKASVKKGNEGTEESVKALSGSDINLLHFATHGFYMEGLVDYQSGENMLPPMMRAGLMCSSSEHPLGNTEDGILLAREIADLDFSSVNMCFLSACETARGDVTADGVFGIQRGFKQAGVGTLVMSLWQVNDELAQLMTTAFYRGLVVDKLERHEAFKRARAEAKAKYPSRDWAAFIMLD